MNNYILTYHDGSGIATRTIEAEGFYQDELSFGLFVDVDKDGDVESENVVFAIERSRFISCERVGKSQGGCGSVNSEEEHY